MAKEQLFSTRRVSEITGASYRQLDYWARLGAVVPLVDANGSGTRRGYTLTQVRLARAACLLALMGAQCDTIRAATRALADSEWMGAVVVTTAGDVVALDAWDGTPGWALDLFDVRMYVEMAFGAAASEPLSA